MERSCDSCGSVYAAKSKRSRFCSDLCRARNKGKPPRPDEATEPTEAASHPLVVATRAELEAAGRLDSRRGQQALTLAAHLAVSLADTGSARAALSRELDALMVKALDGAVVDTDEFDELAARRDRKLSG